MPKDPVHLPIHDRLRIYTVNFIFNGMLGMFLFVLFIWFVLPTSYFFKYDSVEPEIVPVDITKDHIAMVSNIRANNTNGNFHWNDVLRCNHRMNSDGPFRYVGQSDSSVQVSRVQRIPHLSPWHYTGNMPEERALCEMHSTVTRYVLGYIPKQQFIKSQQFIVE